MNLRSPIHIIMLVLAAAGATTVGLSSMLSATVGEPASPAALLAMLALVGAAAAWSYPEFLDTAGSTATGMTAGLGLFVAHLYTTTAVWAEPLQYELIFRGGILSFGFVIFTFVGVTAASAWSVRHGWHSSKRLRELLMSRMRR